MRRRLALACAFVCLASAARAEVVFGDNVHIGGHDVSHQRYDARHRGVFHLYSREPRHAGCVTRRNPDGSQTRVCRWKTLH